MTKEDQLALVQQAILAAMAQQDAKYKDVPPTHTANTEDTEQKSFKEPRITEKSPSMMDGRGDNTTQVPPAEQHNVEDSADYVPPQPNGTTKISNYEVPQPKSFFTDEDGTEWVEIGEDTFIKRASYDKLHKSTKARIQREFYDPWFEEDPKDPWVVYNGVVMKLSAVERKRREKADFFTTPDFEDLIQQKVYEYMYGNMSGPMPNRFSNAAKNVERGAGAKNGADGQPLFNDILERMQRAREKKAMYHDDNIGMARCQTMPDNHSVTVNGKTFPYKDVVGEITLQDLALPTQEMLHELHPEYGEGEMIHHSLMAIRQAFTRLLLSQFKQMKRVVVHGGKFIVDGYCFRPKVPESVRASLPFNLRDLAEHGLFAEFIVWGMLPLDSITTLVIEDWDYLFRNVAHDLQLSGTCEYVAGAMFMFCPRLSKLIVDEMELTYPLSEEMQEMFEYRTIMDNLYDKWYDKMEQKGTLKLARYSTDCMRNYWNSPNRKAWGVVWRVGGWLGAHAMDVIARKPLSAARHIANVGEKGMRGIVNMFRKV